MFNCKFEAGLTIIEALIAILIIGMIASSLMLANQQSFNISNESKMRNTAINLARERIESLKYLDRNDSMNVLTRDSAVWQALDGNSEVVHLNGINYTITTTIENTTNVNTFFKNNRVIPIRITVNWQFNGANRSIFLDTCFTQY
ncbi:MAG: hypothetical protein GX075_04010 [Firmicutes bacterium]|nr:hypothetical protein [Bacillota bacterium]